jgi:hypothetical protein
MLQDEHKMMRSSMHNQTSQGKGELNDAHSMHNKTSCKRGAER